MSARGWAGVVRQIAREIEIALDRESGRIEYGGPMFERTDVDRLREIAALLEKITPEIAGDALMSDMRHSEITDLLRALQRGPAEQQETGR